MAGYLTSDNRKVTTHRLIEMKQRGEKISMLTSYDYTTAQIVEPPSPYLSIARKGNRTLTEERAAKSLTYYS